ncbi:MULTISPECIES: AraC family transcriptional regulator [unclassified Crossiella]|uniref:AraC family transcriptional regulator n=1 Tax=unclassified Crossiella TaxID=2620835 RepID=UPI001FFF6DD1|nr:MULTISPECIES: AraC family transcriptional regulator [unclassified Crossiella]MCK2238257.1 AraC family transcriptional regulator [Crossiella sp. S99.2]MCK2256297.1 AraC family transcriptional regulator [Crossiella sp. S99.1]
MSASGLAGQDADFFSQPPAARRGLAGVRALLEVGAEHGVPPADCLRESGVAESALGDGAARIPAGAELLVAWNLVRATGNPPGLGLAVGGRLRLPSYGVWGFAMLASATLREAAVLGVRHLGLTYALAGIGVREVADEVRMTVADQALPPPLRRFVVERELTAARAILGAVLGEPLVPQRVELRFSPAEAPYARTLGAPVVFDARHNALIAQRGLLDRRLPQADGRTRRVCERECAALLASLGGGATADRVRARLRAHAEGVPEMPVVAAELHVSTRTLHRRLIAEGVSYRRLAEEIRRVRALELLERTELAVAQVAARLGYADAAVFTRAFRRWTGTTPGAYRRTR